MSGSHGHHAGGHHHKKPAPPVKHILVEIDRQVLTAFEGSSKVFEFDCTTGRADHPTPKGTFHILHKHEKYTSHTYKVPMDHAMFFTTTGEAIHESPLVLEGALKGLVGLVGSHGCVRLSPAHATTLFKWAHLKTEVVVK